MRNYLCALRTAMEEEMIKHSLMVGAAILCLSGTGLTQSPPPPAPGFRLVFSDDFKNLDLSPDGHGAHKWYEGVWFSHHHAPLENIKRTADGLELTWTRGQEQPDTSISTFARNGATSHAWRYGYYEVRMKWKPEPGGWPAAWLIPSIAGHVHESGEVDIFEGNGDNPHNFYGTIHDWREAPDNPHQMVDVANNGKSNRYGLPSGTHLDEYHTYGLLWEPGRMTWFFDDKPLHSETSYPIFGQQDYCLIIGMQEGSNWKAGNLDHVTATRMDLDLQWVRIWQK